MEKSSVPRKSRIAGGNRREDRNMFRTRFSWADGAILLTVLCFAGLLFALPFLRNDSGTQLIITSPQGSFSYPLAKECDIPVQAGELTLTVEIRSGKARVSRSNCPDGVCVASGWIGEPGQSVVCAPADVRLLITGVKGGTGDVDFVAG